MTYKIGQILTSTEDTVVEKGLSGEKVVIPKGNKIIIGADGFAHHIKNGRLQPLPKDTEISGYDEVGLAEYLCAILKARFPIDEMLEDYGLTEEVFQEEIECALSEIGLD